MAVTVAGAAVVAAVAVGAQRQVAMGGRAMEAAPVATVLAMAVSNTPVFILSGSLTLHLVTAVGMGAMVVEVEEVAAAAVAAVPRLVDSVVVVCYMRYW